MSAYEHIQRGVRQFAETMRRIEQLIGHPVRLMRLQARNTHDAGARREEFVPMQVANGYAVSVADVDLYPTYGQYYTYMNTGQAYGPFRVVYTDPGIGSDLAVGQFQVTPFPGCCGLAIVTGVYNISSIGANRGMGTELFKLAEAIALLSGYTVLVATDVDRNVASASIMRKLGYEKMGGFTNRRTNNAVSMYRKEL